VITVPREADPKRLMHNNNNGYNVQVKGSAPISSVFGTPHTCKLPRHTIARLSPLMFDILGASCTGMSIHLVALQ